MREDTTMLSDKATMLVQYFNQLTSDVLENGTDWYHTAYLECLRLSRLYFVPLDVVVAIVAVMSPLLNWDRNIGAAVDVLEGRYPKSVFGKNANKAMAILRTWDIPAYLRGPKVNNFYSNILNAADPMSDTDCVTIDTWAAKIWGWVPKNMGVNPKEYEVIKADYLAAAESVNVEPKKFQAALWVAARTGQLQF